MPCDALSYKFVATELNNTLSGGKIEKLNMPEGDELFILIRANRQNYTLVISAGIYPRVHITENQKENPLTPPAFCMNLRKNLAGGIIKAIRQEDDERVLFIDILFKTELGIREDKTLICEIMGKYSNIILTDENNKIIESLKHIPLDVSTKRQILPGLRYTPATQEKLSPLDTDRILQIHFNDVYSDILKNIKGLAPSAIAEVVFNADSNSSAKIAEQLKNLYTLPLSPCVFLKDDSADTKHDKNDFFIRPYNSLKGEYLFFDSLSKAMDYYYTSRDQKSRLLSKSRAYLTIAKNALKRAEKRLSDFYLKVEESSKSEDDRIKGELITANIYLIKSGDTMLKVNNYYDNTEALIQLDPTLSPSQNAQKYYKRYAKKKRTLIAATQQAAKTEADIAAYEELIYNLSNIDSVKELADIAEEMAVLGLIKPIKRQKNEKISQPHKTVVDGYTVLIGKNNIQNDRLLKKAYKNDIWLHVRLSHGSHVIIDSLSSNSINNLENEESQLSIGGQRIPDNVILAAAEYAAYYSKSKNQGKVEVDYTLIRHVSKPSGSPPGKVVYTNQKTIVVIPKPLQD